MTFGMECAWQAAPGITDRDLAATWSLTTVSVGGKRLELHDTATGTVRAGYYGSMLPFAEWCIEAWGRLIHERVRLPGSSAARRWRGAHAIVSSREGGAIPDVRFRRIDDEWFDVEALPDAHALPGISVRFFQAALARLPAESVERELARLVRATLERLASVSPGRTTELLERWATRLDPMARIAGRLGLDQEELSSEDTQRLHAVQNDESWRTILEIAEAVPGAIADRLRVGRAIAASIPAPTEARAMWKQLRSVTGDRRGRPWATGWATAAAFRRVLELGNDHVFGDGLGPFLDARCGWHVALQVRPLPSELEHLRGVYVCAPATVPTILTPARDQRARRFRLAKALYYSLYGVSDTERTAVVDTPTLPLYSEANAFAAELLAPVAALRQATPPDGVWEPRDIYRAARALQVNPQVVLHQVENRDLGAIAA